MKPSMHSDSLKQMDSILWTSSWQRQVHLHNSIVEMASTIRDSYRCSIFTFGSRTCKYATTLTLILCIACLRKLFFSRKQI